MKEVFHWTEHLFWEIGWAFLSLLRGNVSEAVEMLYWIRVHLTYHGEYIPVKKLFLTEIKIKCTAIIGLSAMMFICFLIGNLINKIL